MKTKGFLVLIDGIVQSYLIYNKEEADKEVERLANKYNKQAILVETVLTFEPQEINKEVDSYEAALKYLGRENEGKIIRPGVDNKAILAIYKLCVIAEAWNKADNFIPDFDDLNQDKWYPWFVKINKYAGFVSAISTYAPSLVNAYLGARLCFKTKERAGQFGIQFVDLCDDFLLFK